MKRHQELDLKLGVVVHTFNPSLGGRGRKILLSLSSRTAKAIQKDLASNKIKQQKNLM